MLRELQAAVVIAKTNSALSTPVSHMSYKCSGATNTGRASPHHSAGTVRHAPGATGRGCHRQDELCMPCDYGNVGRWDAKALLTAGFVGLTLADAPPVAAFPGSNPTHDFQRMCRERTLIAVPMIDISSRFLMVGATRASSPRTKKC